MSLRRGVVEACLNIRGYWASLASCGTSQQVPTVRSTDSLRETIHTARTHKLQQRQMYAQPSSTEETLVLQCRQRRPAGLSKAMTRWVG